MRISFHFGSGHGPRHRRHHYRGYNRGVSVGTTVSSNTGKIIIAVILLFIAGIVFFVNSNNKNRTANYVETNGRVIDYKMNDGLYGEVVEYEVNGYKYIVYSNSYSNFPKSIGSVVTVRYNPAAPSHAVLNTASNNILIYGIIGVFGVVGVLLLLSGLKNRKSLVDDEE